ncbi:MAG: hypothetical protein ACQEQL_04215 [Pseudomonadota bacterium]
MQENDIENKKNYIFYHAPCLDGMASRLVADYFFGKNAFYAGCGHGANNKPYYNIPENNKVYFLDYAPDEENLLHLLENLSADVTILDHHISAMKTLKKVEHKKLTKILNREESGAGLTWNYFYPRINRPLYIDIIEAIDLNNVSFFKNADQFYNIAAYFDRFPLDDFAAFTLRIKEIEKLSLADIEDLGLHYRQNNQKKILEDIRQAKVIKLNTTPDDYAAVLINTDLYEHSREFIPFLRQRYEVNAILLWLKDGANSYRINIHTSDNEINAQNILSHIKAITQCKGGGHEDSTVARMNKAQFEAFLDWVGGGVSGMRENLI